MHTSEALGSIEALPGQGPESGAPMPGKWVGGRGSVAAPTKDQFIEGKTVDEYGNAQGTVLVRVKRIFAPGEKGRFFL